MTFITLMQRQGTSRAGQNPWYETPNGKKCESMRRTGKRKLSIHRGREAMIHCASPFHLKTSFAGFYLRDCFLSVLRNLALICLCGFSAPLAADRSELHQQIDDTIQSLASPDPAERQRAVSLLLAAPIIFRENMHKALKDEARVIANSLPQQLDEYTTFEAIIVTDDYTLLRYIVHLEPGRLVEESKNELKNYLHRQSLMNSCRSPGSVLLSLLFGKSVYLDYRYATGVPIFTLSISWEDCENMP
jgi:hypothetical protein